MNGLEALAEIKNNPSFESIPVIVLTTSSSDEDIVHSYELGAASFIPKPLTFGCMVHAIASLGTYWFEIVEMPVTN